MQLFDAYLPLGRTNGAVKEAPLTADAALALMDRYDVAEALVGHVLGRDCNPAQGNLELGDLASPRLHKVFAFEPAFTAPQAPAAFLEDALARGAKAVLVNPGMGAVNIHRSPRVRELAALLATRRIPLLVAHNIMNGPQDSLDWHALADFCKDFPGLPVLAWQHRSRSNRPLLDALALAPNLAVLLSTMWQAQMLETVVEHFGPERVVFSMGLPGLHPSSFQAVLAYAGIDEEARQAVGAGNLRRLLAEATYE